MNLKNAAKFIHVAECESTQDLALEISLKENTPVIVLADEQKKGRGRRGREWASNKSKSLTMSLSLPSTTENNTGLLSLLAGASLFIALEKISNDFSKLTLKWPNDLGVYKKNNFIKVAGVLIEAKKNWIIIGWGLNLSGKAPWDEAISLEDISSVKLPKKEILAQEIGNIFYEGAQQITQSTFAAQLLEFLSNKAMQQLWNKELGKNWKGHTALGLTADASLLTRDEHNNRQLIYSGEI